MSRRYHSKIPIDQTQIVLEGPEFHHLSHVGRLRVGDSLTLFDGLGYETEGTIQTLSKKEAVISFESRRFHPGILPFKLTIGMALPKGDREMFLVEKLTELGVGELVPLITKRSIVHPRDSKQRLNRYGVEACKQSGRNMLPEIGELTPISTFLESCPHLEKWILHPVLNGANSGPTYPLPTSIALAVGPEGGFDSLEIQKAKESGWKLWAIPGNILRIETAAISAAAIIRGLCPA